MRARRLDKARQVVRRRRQRSRSMSSPHLRRRSLRTRSRGGGPSPPPPPMWLGLRAWARMRLCVHALIPTAFTKYLLSALSSGF